jgi:GDP-mannose 6-dehydrogenase
VIRNSEVIVVTNKEDEFKEIMSKYPQKIILDLVRMWKDVNYNGIYEGLSWGDVNKYQDPLDHVSEVAAAEE